MTPVTALIAKELRSYFVSPVVYVVAAVFLLIFGVLAYAMVLVAGTVAIQQMQFQQAAAQLNLNDLVLRPAFGNLRLILLLVLPLLTMRLFAEERKLRTFELLMTSPIGTNEIVTGKFMAVLALFMGMLSLTLLTPLTLSLFSSFDWRPVWTGYLALVLLGGLFLATGLLASALTENQIVAAFLSFGFLLVLWLVGSLGSILGDTTAGNFFTAVSFIDHFDRLLRGLIDTKDLVYYLSGIVLMLFLAHRVVDAQRWT